MPDDADRVDPLLALLRDQIAAQREVAASMTAYAEAIARWQSDMSGMKRTADDAIRALEHATKVEAQRLAAQEREEKREGRRYDVVGRVVGSPWAMALGGGLVAWVLQRLGVAVETAAAPAVQP